jgi:hypothetical protein
MIVSQLSHAGSVRSSSVASATAGSTFKEIDMTIQNQVLSTEARNGMSYRREIWSMEGNDPVEMNAVYNADGIYVGDTETADYLASKGILPEGRTTRSSVCSIGFSAKDQKWYGWSHRAIFGFSIGDVATEGDCVCEPGSVDPAQDVTVPVGFTAKTLDDAKRMAIAFAESVG